MDRNALKALADRLQPMAAAPVFDGLDIPALCDFLRQCAEQRPIGEIVEAHGLTGVSIPEMPAVGTMLYAAPVPPQREPLSDMTKAAQAVLAERRRQIEAEGWTPEHDDEHSDGALAAASACYAMHSAIGAGIDSGRTSRYADLRSDMYLQHWPWARDWWKPGDQRRNLVKAGALILAEIERLDRMGGSDER